MEYNNLEKHKDFNKRKYPTVKATVAGILLKNGKILLTERALDLKEGGKWCIPGGHIDIGETALQSVKRELKEETGLKMKNPKFFNYYDEYVPRLKTHAVVLVFYSSPSGKEKSNHEVVNQKWFSKKEIKNLKLAFYHKNILNDFFKIKK
ncbi:NUDIX hydrolase [Candidatus Pacearchaeota archaeon]|nr:NUDIX hydrolase [Candidatus Pacearchaeota archaeon]